MQEVFNKSKLLFKNCNYSDEAIFRAINKYNEIFAVIKESLGCKEEYDTRWNIFTYQDTQEGDFKFKYGIYELLIELASKPNILSLITPVRIIMRLDWSLSEIETYIEKYKRFYKIKDWRKGYYKYNSLSFSTIYTKLKEGKREAIYSSSYVSEEEKNVIAKLDMISADMLILMRNHQKKNVYSSIDSFGVGILISTAYNYFALNNLFINKYDEIIRFLNHMHDNLDKLYEKFMFNNFDTQDRVIEFFDNYYKEIKDNKTIKKIK